MIDNFDHLVERCTARRRKRMIRLSMLIVGTILFIIAAVSGYSMWLSSKEEASVQQPVSHPPITATTVSADVPVPESNTTAPIAAETVPQSVAAPQTAPIPLPKSVPVSNNTAKPAVAPLSTVEKPVAPPLSEIPKTEKSRLFEVDTDPRTPPQDPVKAYDANPKYETALAAARDFYAKKEFSDAAVWAKKANALNREGEEAWLLYAKSYYAQGRKNEAMNVLELYMNYKDSKAAAELLHSWKRTPSN